VASIVGAVNLITGRVESHTNAELGALSVHGTTLYTADPLEHGTEAVLSIRPEDIIVARDSGLTSARNEVPVIIADVEKRGPFVWITGKADGLELVAVVTSSGYESLGARPGDRCLFLFKASSLCLVAASDTSPETVPNVL
jgi:molybdate transport system ATP-binding protein